MAFRAERDGHDWIDAARQAGAGGLLVDDVWIGTDLPPEMTLPVVAVRDTAEALLALGRAA